MALGTTIELFIQLSLLLLLIIVALLSLVAFQSLMALLISQVLEIWAEFRAHVTMKLFAKWSTVHVAGVEKSVV